jgi:DNA-binding XRE family transcriptional regulator
MRAKLTEISEAERGVIIENLIHDLAALDSTTEAEAAEIHARLVAEGRIDLERSAASHQRLLGRLGVKPEPESPQALAAGELLRAYEAHRGVSREEIARELGVALQTLGNIELDTGTRSRPRVHRSRPQAW